MFCNSIEDLWIIDNYIPFKDTNLCEILRDAILWVIWKERNILIFQGGNHKSIRTLGGSIIALIKYRCQLKGNNYTDTLHLVISFNTNELPLQCTTGSLSLLHIEEEEWFGAVIELNWLPLFNCFIISIISLPTSLFLLHYFFSFLFCDFVAAGWDKLETKKNCWLSLKRKLGNFRFIKWKTCLLDDDCAG
jgi:hypothetical protein